MHVSLPIPDCTLPLQIPVALPEGRVYQRMAFGPPGSDMLAASYEVGVDVQGLCVSSIRVLHECCFRAAGCKTIP